MAAAVVGLGLLLGAASARADVTLLFWPGPESEAMQKVVQLSTWNEESAQTVGVRERGSDAVPESAAAA